MTNTTTDEQVQAADAEERDQLRAMVLQHNGNISAMAQASETTRQALTRRLKRHGLLAEADVARGQARLSGPRTHLSKGLVDPDAEAQQLLDALAQHGSFTKAAAALGVPRRTLFRRAKTLKISQSKVIRRRKELTAATSPAPRAGRAAPRRRTAAR